MRIRQVGPSAFASLPGRLDGSATRALQRFGSASHEAITEIISTGRDARGFIGRVDTASTLQSVAVGPIERTATGHRVAIAARPPFDATLALIEKGRRPNRKTPAPGSPGWLKVRAWVAKHLRNEALAGLAGASVKIGKDGRVKVGGKRSSPVVTVTGPDSRARVEKAIDGMTFVVLRAMRRKGFPGLHPIEQTAKVMRAGRFRAIYREELRAQGGRR